MARGEESSFTDIAMLFCVSGTFRCWLPGRTGSGTEVTKRIRTKWYRTMTATSNAFECMVNRWGGEEGEDACFVTCRGSCVLKFVVVGAINWRGRASSHCFKLVIYDNKFKANQGFVACPCVQRGGHVTLNDEAKLTSPKQRRGSSLIVGLVRERS